MKRRLLGLQSLVAGTVDGDGCASVEIFETFGEALVEQKRRERAENN